MADGTHSRLNQPIPQSHLMPKVEKLAEFDQRIIPWYGKWFYLFPLFFTLHSLYCFFALAFSPSSEPPFPPILAYHKGTEEAERWLHRLPRIQPLVHIDSYLHWMTTSLQRTLHDIINLPAIVLRLIFLYLCSIPHIHIRQQPRQAKQSIAYDRGTDGPGLGWLTSKPLSLSQGINHLFSLFFFMSTRTTSSGTTTHCTNRI